MKPPPFRYHDPTTLDQALGLLAEYADDAKILAGGQSLMPLLNFRLARPAHLIDLNRIAELSLLAAGSDGRVRLGALVRQRTLERSACIGQSCPLLGQAMPYVGHPQIRNRGTLGGSLAHADPAAELPAVMLALDATFTLRRASAQRTVAANDFFVSYLSTALQPDELLAEITLPPWPPRTGSSLQEVAIRLGDFALSGVAATLTLDDSHRVARARLVCFGVDERPLRLTEAEQSLVGQAPSEQAFAEAGRLVSARLEPRDDIHASGAYRKRVTGVLATRALAASLSALGEQVATPLAEHHR